ncbi:MAG: DUF4175 family protein [Pseudobdellovibrionaceae bacterium]
MSTPDDPNIETPPPQSAKKTPFGHEFAHFLASKRGKAALILWAEEIGACFFACFIVIAVMGGLAMTGLPQAMGTAGRTVFAIIGLIGFALTFVRGLQTFQIPDKKEIDARLEADSKLRHTPLSGVEDHLVEAGDYERQALWRLHIWRLKDILRHRLKVRPPRFSFSPKDPFAIGVFAALLLLIGFVMAGKDWSVRLGETFVPFRESAKQSQDSALSITFIPPEYTRLEQKTFTKRELSTKLLELPEGTKARFLLKTHFGKPDLKWQDIKTPFKKLDDDVYGLETTLTGTVTKEPLKIIQHGFSRLRVPVTLLPDEAPKVALNGEPSKDMDGALTFPLKVEDDYGIMRIKVRMSLPPDTFPVPIGKPASEERLLALPLNKGEPKEISERFDLTGHIWAGNRVELRFLVTDAAGHIGQSDPIPLTLPERKFHDPFAKDIIQIRKELAFSKDYQRRALGDSLFFLRNELHRYDGDKTIFLALTIAGHRLHMEADDEATLSVVGMLWDIAMEREQGHLYRSSQEVAKAREGFMEKLHDPNSTKESKMEALSKLREALQKFWQDYMKEAQDRLARGEPLPTIDPEMAGQMIDPGAMDDFLAQIEQEMLDGNMEKVEQMFAQMENMLKSLNPSMAQSMSPEMRETAQALGNMQDMISDQEDILKETLKKAGQHVEEGKYDPNCSNIADKQSGLQKQIAQMETLMQQLGMDTNPLAKANAAMGAAVQELLGNNPEPASKHMQHALDQLKGAQDSLAKKFQQQLAKSGGLPFGFKGGQPQPDPFGRNGKGPISDYSDVKVPDKNGEKPIEEIMKLLRERARQQERPLIERDYYKRLLRQW